jgi:hypothetical protein
MIVEPKTAQIDNFLIYAGAVVVLMLMALGVYARPVPGIPLVIFFLITSALWVWRDAKRSKGG